MTALTIDHIAEQMRGERQRLGLSITQAAERVQMPAVVLGSYERGDRQPPLPKLRAWVEGMSHKLLAVPTNTGVAASMRIDYAVAYGPDGLIECDSEEDARALAEVIFGGRLVSRTVRVGAWGDAR